MERSLLSRKYMGSDHASLDMNHFSNDINMNNVE